MKLLIVDDESLVIEDIVSLIDWRLLNVHTVLTARSVEQAQQLMREHEPDIVLCDIEMPHVSGLQLLAWSKEHLPKTEIIMLTCHASFSYAQTALRLGSFDYILKPVEAGKLSDAIQAAQGKLHQREQIGLQCKQGTLWVKHRDEWIEQYWVDLLTGRLGSTVEEWGLAARKRNVVDALKTELQLILMQYPGSCGSERMTEAARQSLTRYWSSQRCGHRLLEISESVYVYVLLPNAGHPEWDEIVAGAPWDRQKCAVWVGRHIPIREAIREYGRLLGLAADNVYERRGLFATAEEKPDRQETLAQPDMVGWTQQIASGQIEGVLTKIERWLFSDEAINRLTRADLAIFQNDLEQALYQALQQRQIYAHQFLYHDAALQRRLDALGSVYAMTGWVKWLMQSAVDVMREMEKPNRIVDQAKLYISAHMTESISRSEIAEVLYLNPDYLDRVFRRETGLSVNKYLLQKRLELACTLLSRDEPSINSIAFQCGYSSQSNFTSMFKREIGMTPAEYRKHIYE